MSALEKRISESQNCLQFGLRIYDSFQQYLNALNIFSYVELILLFLTALWDSP